MLSSTRDSLYIIFAIIEIFKCSRYIPGTCITINPRASSKRACEIRFYIPLINKKKTALVKPRRAKEKLAKGLLAIAPFERAQRPNLLMEFWFGSRRRRRLQLTRFCSFSATTASLECGRGRKTRAFLVALRSLKFEARWLSSLSFLFCFTLLELFDCLATAAAQDVFSWMWVNEGRGSTHSAITRLLRHDFSRLDDWNWYIPERQINKSALDVQNQKIYNWIPEIAYLRKIK